MAAGRLGLDPAGVSFHVGSQQRNPHAWARADRVGRAGLRRRCAPPASTRGCSTWAAASRPGSTGSRCRSPTTAAPSTPQLTAAFGADRPRTLVEPGRGVVGDAGTVVTSVVGVVDRGGTRWVFVDAGVFTGLVETLDEAIRYRLETPGVTGPTGPCVLAGPTCDSADVLYETTPVWLPLSLAEGDELRIHAAGAYSTCYSTVGFNGFAPLPTVITR